MFWHQVAVCSFLVASLHLVILDRVNTLGPFSSLDLYIALGKGNGFHSTGVCQRLVRLEPWFTPSGFLLQANILRTPSLLPY